MTGPLVFQTGSTNTLVFYNSSNTYSKLIAFGSLASNSNKNIYLPPDSGTLISDYSLNNNGLRLGWDYLININATTSATNYTLQNSRKFSDYAYILFLCNDGGLVRNPSIIPRALFDGSSDGTKRNVEIDYGNLQTMRWVSFKHTSDTQVLITAYANSTVAVQVIGLKIKVS